MNNKSVEDLIEELDVYDVQKCVEITEQIVEYGNDAVAPLFNAFLLGTKTSQKEYMLQALSTLLDSQALIEELLKYIDDTRGFTRYYSLQYLFDMGDQSVRQKLIPHMIADIGGHYYCNDFARNTLPKCSEFAIDQIISALMIELEHPSEHNYERLQHLMVVVK